MYQGPDGQWYDENGRPAQNAPDSGGSPAPPSGSLNSSTSGGGPTGIPDPNHQGYDTGGFWLGNVEYFGGGATGENADPAVAAAAATAAGNPPPPPPAGSGGSPAPANNAGFQWPGYTLPTPYQFTPFNFDSYTPLTGEAAAAEPGYAFARDQGRNAIETSAAAKGNVLSGANLKDLFSWGDQFAGQNYQNAESRNQNIYNMNRGNAFNNWAGNQAAGLSTWQANNQPPQFASGLQQQQAGLTFADLFNRFKTGVDASTAIATAGAQ